MLSIRHLAAAVGAMVAASALPRASADPEMEEAFQKLVEQHAATLVTVKFVLKVKMGGAFGALGDQENEGEVSGVMIAADGLILVSNTQLGGIASFVRRFAGGRGEITAVPTDLKVLIGDDTVGLDAELLARDSELDLAWVRIKEAGERKFDAISLTESAKPRLGQKLLMVGRMGKYFDRVPTVTEFRIAGFTSKPRELYVPTGAGGSLGLPVYTTDGTLVGVTILQVPAADDTGSNPLAMFGQMGDSGGAMILPASEVVRATQRARQTVAEDEDEEESEVGAGVGDD